MPSNCFYVVQRAGMFVDVDILAKPEEWFESDEGTNWVKSMLRSRQFCGTRFTSISFTERKVGDFVVVKQGQTHYIMTMIKGDRVASLAANYSTVVSKRFDEIARKVKKVYRICQ